MSGGVGAVAEGAADAAAVEGLSGEGVGAVFGVGEGHAAEAGEVGGAGFDGGLGGVDGVLLESGCSFMPRKKRLPLGDVIS